MNGILLIVFLILKLTDKLYFVNNEISDYNDVQVNVKVIHLQKGAFEKLSYRYYRYLVS